MNIYKLSQTENKGWDTFDSMIVLAEDEDQAKSMFPHSDNLEGDYDFSTNYWGRLDYWEISEKAKIKRNERGGFTKGVFLIEVK